MSLKKTSVSGGAQNSAQQDREDVAFFKDVLSKALKNKEFCIKLVNSSIKSQHFPRPYLKWTYEVLRKFFGDIKYGGNVPTLKIFKNKLERDRNLSKELKVSFYEKIAQLYSRKVDNVEYSLQVVEDKVMLKDFKGLLKKTITDIGEFDDPKVAIDNLVNKSFKVANQSKFEVVDLLKDHDKRQKEREYKSSHPQQFKRFHFGIPSVDACIPGGLVYPMFANVAAKTNIGKSIMAMNEGVEALMQGFGVTHIISEDEIDQTTDRYDSRITQLAFDDIQLDKLSNDDKKKMRITFEKMKKKCVRSLKVVKVSPNEFNVAIILQILNYLESQGHKTTFLIIDSPDLMQSVAKHVDKRLQQSAIYWEVRALLELKKCIGFATTQLKAKSDDENPAPEDMAESYDKARLLNFSMILTQTKTQRSNNEASLSIVKNRHGRKSKGPVLLATTFETMSYVEKPQEDEEIPPGAIDNLDKKKSSKFEVSDGKRKSKPKLEEHIQSHEKNNDSSNISKLRSLKVESRLNKNSIRKKTETTVAAKTKNTPKNKKQK